MFALEILLLLLCGIVGGVQAVLLLELYLAVRNSQSAALEDDECPPVLVVMCLRGSDPFLASSLSRLFRQDYPDYEIRVVVDSRGDPARRLVEDVRRRVGVRHVEILTLESHDELCSAKMSSLLLGTANLPEHTQIVATIDGDCVMHRSCLRELVAPLVRENVAVTTGNRWFAPPQRSVGGFARLQWNVGCVSVMNAAALPWGGCLAMQRGVIEDAEVRNHYRHAFAEDMLLGSLMQKRGHRVEYVPQATIVNHEDISLAGLYRFLTRQMLCVRLHHHRWVIIIGWACMLSAVLGVMCPLGLLVPGLRPASASGLAVIAGASALPMLLALRAIRRLTAAQGEHLQAWTPSTVAMLLLSAPLMHWISLAASVRAIFARSINWRGLTYELARDPQLRLVHEEPVPSASAALGPAEARLSEFSSHAEAIPADHSTVS
jgi:hypothetical protein